MWPCDCHERLAARDAKMLIGLKITNVQTVSAEHGGGIELFIQGVDEHGVMQTFRISTAQHQYVQPYVDNVQDEVFPGADSRRLIEPAEEPDFDDDDRTDPDNEEDRVDEEEIQKESGGLRAASIVGTLNQLNLVPTESDQEKGFSPKALEVDELCKALSAEIEEVEALEKKDRPQKGDRTWHPMNETFKEAGHYSTETCYVWEDRGASDGYGHSRFRVVSTGELVRGAFPETDLDKEREKLRADGWERDKKKDKKAKAKHGIKVEHYRKYLIADAVEKPVVPAAQAISHCQYSRLSDPQGCTRVVHPEETCGLHPREPGYADMGCSDYLDDNGIDNVE